LRKEVADRRSLLWDNVRRFDQDTSNSFDLWDKLPEEVQDQYCEGYDLWDTDPEGAFALFELSAANGNPSAMIAEAACCERGNGTAKDGKRAKQFFRDAVEAGSWHATIHYARFLERAGDQELAYLTLEDGVDAEYTAAYFWLAWLLYKAEPNRRMAREVFSMVEHAVAKGHPGGRWLKAKLLFKGHMGVMRVAEGYRIQRKLSGELGNELKELGRSNFD